jgi:hypothetical protein
LFPLCSYAVGGTGLFHNDLKYWSPLNLSVVNFGIGLFWILGCIYLICIFDNLELFAGLIGDLRHDANLDHHHSSRDFLPGYILCGGVS